MHYRIAILGPQGSGKGTQARRLAAALHIPHIAPGTMFRQEVASGTELGAQVAPLIERGEMVPNDITNAMVARRLAAVDCANGYILDGFPRDLDELEAYEGFAEPFTHAVLLDLDDDLAVERLSNRWMCSCGQPHTGAEIARQRRKVKRCASCGEPLHRRRDDYPEAIRRRLENYHRDTEPVIAAYRARGILTVVEGSGTIDDVFARMVAQLGFAKKDGG